MQLSSFAGLRVFSSRVYTLCRWFACFQPGVSFLVFLCFVWFACEGELSSFTGLLVCSSCVNKLCDILLVQPGVSFLVLMVCFSCVLCANSLLVQPSVSFC